MLTKLLGSGQFAFKLHFFVCVFLLLYISPSVYLCLCFSVRVFIISFFVCEFPYLCFVFCVSVFVSVYFFICDFCLRISASVYLLLHVRLCISAYVSVCHSASAYLYLHREPLSLSGPGSDAVERDL